MTSKILNLVLSTAFLGLVACDKGGSDDKKTTAVVPAAPERIFATSSNGMQDQNNYCEISVISGGQKSVICYSVAINGGPACAGPVIPFTDANLCPTIQNLPFQMNSCGQIALRSLVQQKCVNQNQNQNLNPNFPQQPITNIGGQPIDANFKTIQCDFEAIRLEQTYWSSREFSTGRLTTSFPIDSRVSQKINLRGRFFNFDISSFGDTTMTFTPASLRGSPDKITVANSGLNRTITTSQTGFAGQEVKLEAQNDDGTMRLMVSCVGRSQFKKNLAAKNYSKLSCKGTSNLGSRTEKIDLLLAYDNSLTQNEINLADNLVMNVSGDSGPSQDDARVSIAATSMDDGLTIKTSAYLKTSAQLKIDSGYLTVDVTCTPVQ